MRGKYLRKKTTNYALPFFLVLTFLSAVSLIIPLRPTFSYSERRELTKFPDFSAEALFSGDYFDAITLWFSDTFPGREGWLDVSQSLASLHGYSEIAIAGPLDQLESPEPVETPESNFAVSNTEATEATSETGDAETESAETTESTEVPSTIDVTEIDVNDIYLGNAIQIGESGFNQLSISKPMSDKYARTISGFADRMAQEGIRVISAPAPTAIGIMVDNQYLEQLRCTPPGRNAGLYAQSDERQRPESRHRPGAEGP